MSLDKAFIKAADLLYSNNYIVHCAGSYALQKFLEVYGECNWQANDIDFWVKLKTLDNVENIFLRNNYEVYRKNKLFIEFWDKDNERIVQIITTERSYPEVFFDCNVAKCTIRRNYGRDLRNIIFDNYMVNSMDNKIGQEYILKNKCIFEFKCEEDINYGRIEKYRDRGFEVEIKINPEFIVANPYVEMLETQRDELPPK